MIIEQPSIYLRWMFPKAIWRMDPSQKVLYLTFDDGPIPEATPWILDILDRYQIKATFFMVGENAFKHPELLEEVRKRGHRIGNHTYNHLGAFKHLTRTYLKNTEKANELLKTNLMRPPHGIMRWPEYTLLRKKYNYKIIMWDLVTRDYSKKLTATDVLWNVKHYVRNGSIITFHDSLKSIDKLKQMLPEALEWLLQQGYTFKTLD
ncbi:MAG: polysaccharide deacetylase family protein [Bacteroidales bacterium]|nr:polysaccharide deacetylase family protein [Bacteroidales bacterium]